jgi:hypothetical protein
MKPPATPLSDIFLSWYIEFYFSFFSPDTLLSRISLYNMFTCPPATSSHLFSLLSVTGVTECFWHATEQERIQTKVLVGLHCTVTLGHDPYCIPHTNMKKGRRTCYMYFHFTPSLYKLQTVETITQIQGKSIFKTQNGNGEKRNWP